MNLNDINQQQLRVQLHNEHLFSKGKNRSETQRHLDKSHQKKLHVWNKLI